MAADTGSPLGIGMIVPSGGPEEVSVEVVAP